ncbi:hypothetical protein [Flavobacterium filum]|uniref:hypothetical protein n=1 Tax=Flavobacterium TaxID=237 RepID=UPI000410C64F|nr:hypothetical protein [Flavobacterium filum]
MNKKLFLIILIFSTFSVVAQTEIIGKITVNGNVCEGVHVLNLVSEKATISDASGLFSIKVNEDDLLVFSAVHLHYWRKSISNDDINEGFIHIEMTIKEQKLDEVVLTGYSKINAQDLGIIDYKPKSYSPAERRLRPAQLRSIDIINFNSIILPLDPLLYLIAGKTKQLKKELQVEIKEMRLERLRELYEENYFINNLKIPSEYVGSFQYYVIKDDEAMQKMTIQDKTALTFRMAALANDFLSYIANND